MDGVEIQETHTQRNKEIEEYKFGCFDKYSQYIKFQNPSTLDDIIHENAKRRHLPK